jgi:hypothetical protein
MITNFSVIHYAIQKYKPEPIGDFEAQGKEYCLHQFGDIFSFLDPKLNWKQHLTERRKKFYASLWACRRVKGKSCVINPNIAMWMYKTVLLQQILCASVVW